MTVAWRKYLFLCSVGSVLLLIWLWNGFGNNEEKEIGLRATGSTRGEMDELVGDWVLEDHKNFKAVLTELGVNAISRAFAVTLTTYMTIEKINDDEYVIKTITGPVKKTRHMKFGVEFEDEAPTGGNMSGSWKFEDGKMIGKFNFHKDNAKMTIVRFLENGKLIELMTVRDETSKRIFKRKK